MGENFDPNQVSKTPPPQRRRRRRNTGTMIIILVLGFVIGLIAGMLIIHDKMSRELAEVREELATVIEEQSHINVTNVYVPERKLKEGLLSVNPYNSENFRIDNGFMAYFDENGEKISHLGCDLSYHNKYVDFDELAKSGCEFVMLRCGYRGYSAGGLAKDEKFEQYASEAERVGLNLGVYFFTQALTVEEAEEEAEYTLKLIEGHKISYPVAFDTEYIDDESARSNTTEISDELRTEIITAFCEKIKEAGYYPMVYASENWIRRYMNVGSLRQYDFWAPQYLEENDFLYDFTMWQYTDKGSIPGVKGEVDLDISMVDYASFVPKMREALETGGEISTVPGQENITITEEGSQEDISITTE